MAQGKSKHITHHLLAEPGIVIMIIRMVTIEVDLIIVPITAGNSCILTKPIR